MLSSTTLSELNIPLYERIRLDIKSRLVSQAWDPTEPIPSEQSLAVEYGVSIGTIRKAVEHLVQEGLLAKEQGRGTFIKHPDFKSSLLRFFRYRNAADESVVPTGLIQSVKKIAPVAHINQKLALSPSTALIQLERLRLVDEVVVLSECIWLPEPLFGALLDLTPAQFPNLLYPLYYKKCAQFVFSAQESLSFSTDQSDVHLGAVEGDLLVKIERLVHNMEGIPIEYRVSYGHPQNFRYDIRIS